MEEGPKALSHPYRAHHEGGNVVAHSLLLRSRGLMLMGCLAHWPVGWSGMGHGRWLWRVVVLALVLVVVPEIGPAIFPRLAPVASPIAVLERPVRLMALRSVLVALLVTFGSPAPATPPVGSLLVSRLARV